MYVMIVISKALATFPSRTRCRFGWILLAAGIPAIAFGQNYDACGPLKTGHGPFDYRSISAKEKYTVESFHFTPDVENLRKGSSSEKLGGDIDYTLRAIPNHPRALWSMVRLSEREKRSQPRGAQYTVDCYFDRAFRMAPDDPAPRMIFGFYLLRMGKNAEAAQVLEKTREQVGEDANLSYNLGLAYFELGKFDQSLEQAKIAYGLGFPLPGLRDMLKRAGRWRD